MSLGQNTQCFNVKKYKKIENELIAQRKQLEEQLVRLQDESQNTRLLKIQQKERTIDSDYRDRKKKMEDIMEQLGFEAEKFNEEQKRMNQELESKKDALVLTNDRKKKQEDERYKREKRMNEERAQEIVDAKELRQKLEDELGDLYRQIETHKQYEFFLRKVVEMSEDFQVEDKESENGAKQIIERYNTLKAKEKEFKIQSDKIEIQKDEVNREIFQVRKAIETEMLSFNQKQNDYKVKIDELNAQNRRLESEIEGKLNENNSKQAEFAQIIMAVKNLHTQIKLRQVDNFDNIKNQQRMKNHILLILKNNRRTQQLKTVLFQRSLHLQKIVQDI